MDTREMVAECYRILSPLLVLSFYIFMGGRQ